MSEAARAVGTTNGAGGIPARLLSVEGRVTDIEHSHGHMSGLLEQVLERLGKDADGGDQATGLYGKIAAIDKRVTPFEKLREQFKGSMKTLIVLAPPTGIIVWFLAGDRISALLHG